MKLAVLTSNYKGGVLQFAQIIANNAAKTVEDVQLFVPEKSEIPDYKGKVYKYSTQSTIFPYSYDVKKTVDRIVSTSDAVIICDDALIGSKIVIEINKRIPVLLVVHDARPHYTNALKLIKRKIRLLTTEKAYHEAHTICLLSENSKNDFLVDYPRFRDKTITVKLGAHLTTTALIKPPEVQRINNYVLFFGRIDSYKGLDKLVDAYNTASDNSLPPLIIAGAGDISNYKHDVSDAITFINRYISDGEMNWLFNNCCIVVLPYIQATQSGVIPIAYHFGKPVLVSDLPGLTENVIEHQTGEIIKTKSDIINKILHMVNNLDQYSYIGKYYEENYDWEIIVRSLILSLTNEDE